MTAEPQSPNSLIKYCDVKTAEQILSTHALRWSSPEVFGDPFEPNTHTHTDITKEYLLESTVKFASSKIFAREKPKGDSPLIMAIQRWRDDERFATQEESYDVLRELLGKMVYHRLEQLDASMNKWQLYLRNIRVCCFCVEADNLIAWDKYADRHKGVAIRFAFCSGSTTANAKPVIYQAEPAHMTTLKEQLGCILHNKKDGITSRFKDLFISKGSHQKLEQEWRCIQATKHSIPNTDNTPQNWVDDIPFNTDEVTGVYFGINTPDITKKKIISIIKEKYKSAKIYQSTQAKTSYTLEFEAL